MRFSDPGMLHLLWVVPAAGALLLWSARARRRARARFGDEGLVRELSPRVSRGRSLVRSVLLLCGLGFVGISLAGPQWGLVEEKVRRVGVDVVLAVDTSLSMLAEDVRPNRLERARLELRDFLEGMGSDRVGLVVFSSSAHLLVPLTLDVGAIELYLDILDTEITSGKGTAIGDAIDEAVRAFPEKEGGKSRAVLLVTDGEDQGSDPLEAARRAAAAGVRIFTVGVGSVRGEPIPLRDPRGGVTQYKEDEEGRIVTTKLDESTLREISRITGGKYVHLEGARSALVPVQDEISGMQARELKGRVGRRYKERYQWPLGFGLALLSMRTALPRGRRDRRESRRRAG